MNLDTPSAVGIVIILLTPVANLLSSLLKQANWPREANVLVTAAVAAAGGVLVWALTGSLHSIPSLAMIVGSASAIFTASQLVYHGLGFKDSWLDTLLAAVSVAHHNPPQNATAIAAVPGFHTLGRPSEAGPFTAVLDTRPFDVPAPPLAPAEATTS